jgi:hypothetical protein
MMKNLLYSIPGILFLLAGCGELPFRYVIVDTPALSDGPYTEMNWISYSQQHLHWQIDDQAEQHAAFRVKYHPFYTTKHCIVVEGSIADSKKKYPVVLDTGASQAVFVNDIHVLENKLSVYPMQTNKTEAKDYGLGLCYVPQLWIGQMILQDFPCWYLQRHLEIQFFGLTIDRDDSIIIGLTALREFNCIIFDNINKEVEFLCDRTFKPEQETLWSKYPLSIEEDGYGNTFLFVQIPVAGELLKVQLDTGSGNGIALSEELWRTLSGKLNNIKLKNGTDLYPYIGRLDCRKGVIEELQVGNKLIPDAIVSVFPAKSPLLHDCDAILGMQFFQDSVIVLDFNNSLLWVKGSVT